MGEIGERERGSINLPPGCADVARFWRFSLLPLFCATTTTAFVHACFACFRRFSVREDDG